MELSLYFSLAAILLALVITYPLLRNWWILSKPFSDEWNRLLLDTLPVFSSLGDKEQKQLTQMIQLFIAKKRFFGCGGLEINDEIKVSIAAQACLLLLNRKTRIYPRLKFILVYPSSFITQHQANLDDGTVQSDAKAILGESWHHGKVILSWDDVEKGVADFHDGHNVVIHEFSHQLDSESGSTNGAPPLRSKQYKNWASVLSKEYTKLNKAMQRHKKSLLDYYGATNPAEFFAVATETFFEQPKRMASKHPELFAELQKYYRTDPRRWLDSD